MLFQILVGGGQQSYQGLRVSSWIFPKLYYKLHFVLKAFGGFFKKYFLISMGMFLIFMNIKNWLSYIC